MTPEERKFKRLSARAKDVGGKIHSIRHPGLECYVMASVELIREVIEDGSVWRVRGAGRLTVNELRRYAGMKPKRIKRCPCCRQVIK